MRDIEFEPDRVTVAQGETVAFRFINRGQLTHDAFIGDEDEQEEHEAEARAADEDGGGHAAHEEGGGSAITVEPGKSGELTYTFDEPGETLIGCHEPGHYEDGMKVAVTVEST